MKGVPSPAFRVFAAAAVVLSAVAVSGCTGAASGAAGPSAGAPSGSGSPSATAPTPTDSSSTTGTAVATTPSGTKLKLGAPAVVLYSPSPAHSSVLRLTVEAVKQGSLNDLRGFRLSDSAKSSHVFYVSVSVKNVGDGDLGGPLELYGKVSRGTAVAPVILGTTLDKCPYEPLPWPFGPGDRLRMCMVMLAPQHGTVDAVQWRPTDDSKPITWTLRK
jgi:hypothetical protein